MLAALAARGRWRCLRSSSPIHRHYNWQCTGAGSVPLQHVLQVLDSGRLFTHASRHDHLVITVDHQLAFVSLQIGPAGLDEMAVGICEIPLGTAGGSASLPGQDASGHRVSLKSFQIKWFQASNLCGPDRFLLRVFGFGYCHFSFLFQFGLLRWW